MNIAAAAVIIKNLALITLILTLIDILWRKLRSSARPLYIISLELNHVYLPLCILMGFLGVYISRAARPFPLFGVNRMVPTMTIQPALRLMDYGYLDMTSRWPTPIITAMICILFDIDPCWYIYYVSYMLVLLHTAGVFLLSYQLTKSRGASLMASVLSAYAFIAPRFEIFHNHIMNVYRSNTVLQAILPLTLLSLYERFSPTLSAKTRSSKRTVALVVAVLITYLAIYVSLYGHILLPTKYGLPEGFRTYVITPLVFPIIFIALCICARSSLNSMKRDYAVLSLMSLLFFMIHRPESILWVVTVLSFVLFTCLVGDRRAVVALRIFPFPCIIFIILQRLGLVKLYTTYPLSGIVMGWKHKPENVFVWKYKLFLEANHAPLLLLTMISMPLCSSSGIAGPIIIGDVTALLMTIYFAPEYTHRIYMELSTFMGISVSYAVKALLEIMLTHFNIPFKSYRLVFFVTTYLSLVTIVLIPTLVVDVYERFHYAPPRYEYNSIMTMEEYKAAVWLRENLPVGTVIITDFMSNMLITPIANKIWVIEKVMNPQTLPDEDRILLQFIKDHVFKADSSTEAYEALRAVKGHILWREEPFMRRLGIANEDLVYVILLSSRTSKWIDTPGIELTEPLGQFDRYSRVRDEHLRLFMDDRYFELIYSDNEELYIFMVKF
ncbi:MAG: hypothetical protein DRN03_01685 [Thermoplasmata archaeon]|nr:MAG: hypothetical protein DRN03_01685 [Thermoplasmata archaeon]